MKSPQHHLVRPLRLRSFAASVSLLLFVTLLPTGAAPQDPLQNPQFLGAWCAQGDPTKQCSISSSNGFMVNLTNEQGSTSSGHYDGMNRNAIVADQWQFVRGTLSNDGQQINWSNGTYWTRCGGGDNGGGGQHKLRLDGTWYRSGNRSQSCSIWQNGKKLRLTNENGVNADGIIDGKYHLTATWSGTKIGGNVTHRGRQIDWDNGTYWTR
jgi:hypothetical protein